MMPASSITPNPWCFCLAPMMHWTDYFYSLRWMIHLGVLLFLTNHCRFKFDDAAPPGFTI